MAGYEIDMANDKINIIDLSIDKACIPHPTCWFCSIFKSIYSGFIFLIIHPVIERISIILISLAYQNIIRFVESLIEQYTEFRVPNVG